MTTDSTADLSQRVATMSESATLAVSAKAKELRAAGEDVIGFGAGEPDFDTPDHVVEAAQAACADPTLHRYSPAGGMPVLKQAIVDATAAHTGLEADPSEVVIANGGKHALYNVFQALLDPGDAVLIPAPYWTSYPEQVALAGGEPIAVPTTLDQGYKVTPEQLEAARTPRTKAVVFNSPNNPTGAVHSPAEIAAIGRWAAQAGLWVIADEIYEHLVYGDAEFASLPVVAPEAAPRTVVVSGVAKTFAMTGWRVGWTIAPAPLSKAMGTMQSHATSNVANVSQKAALAALTGPMDQVTTMRETYERRRHVAHEKLNAIAGITCPLPEGAFYLYPSVEGLLGQTIGGRTVRTSGELCEALLETAKVAMVPGEAFGAPGHMRISYALDEQQMITGLDRVAEVLG